MIESIKHYFNVIIDVLYYIPLRWFKYRVFPQHRYHILNLRKSGNGYTYGWRDTDSRMLHACFLLLVEYVELEKPFEHIDWNADEKSEQIAQEIKDLYDWWKIRRAEAHDALEKEWASNKEESVFEPMECGGFKIVIPESHKILTQHGVRLDEEDQRNLERLIKIRSWLWT